jgi:hypothetical protein
VEERDCRLVAMNGNYPPRNRQNVAIIRLEKAITRR